MKVFTREQCGLQAPNMGRMALRPAGTVWGITAHVTVTGENDPLNTWREIQASYMNGHNVNHEVYGDIPYNVGITMAGDVLDGRDTRYVGAHALSAGNVANRCTNGVVFIGEGNRITPEAEEAFRVVAWTTSLTVGHRVTLLGHSDWSHFGGPITGCPDPPILAFVRAVSAAAH